MLVAALSLLCAALGFAVCTSARHPPVLVVVVDDLRPHLGASYGDPVAVTPSIDALGTLGVTFYRAYAQQALCGPSRTSFLTSRRPSSTRVVDVHRYWRRLHNYTSLPQHFRQHGYYTASGGKVFHPGISSNFSDDSPYSWSCLPYHPSTQLYKNAPVCGPHSNSTDVVCPIAVEQQPEQTLPDLQTAHYAINFVRKYHQAITTSSNSTDPGPPFFLAVGFHKPHIPLKYPKEFLSLYPLSSVPLPPNRRLPLRLPPIAFNPWNDLRWRHDVAALQLRFPYQPMPDQYARTIIQSYYAAISYTDLLIGRLLSVTSRLFPDTIVAFLGDHGWSLGEHQEWSKFSNYEVATRVPLIIAPIRGYTHARRRAMGAAEGAAVPSSVAAEGAAYPADAVAADAGRKQNLKLYRKIDKELWKKFGSWKGRDDRVQEYEKLWNLDEFVVNFKRKLNLKRDNNDIDSNMRPNPSDMPKATLHSPPMKENYTYEGIVELVDLFPTLADLAGIQRLPKCYKRGDRETEEEMLCTEGRTLAPIIMKDGDGLSLRDYNNGWLVNNSNKEGATLSVHEPNGFLEKRTKLFINTNKIGQSRKFPPNLYLLNVTFSFSWNMPAFSTHLTVPAKNEDNLVPLQLMRRSKPTQTFPDPIIDRPSYNGSKCLHLTRNNLHITHKCCLRDLTHGRVAVSQYPRPSLTPSVAPDSDQPHLTETIAMGYSLRSLCYRYTVWVAFNHTAFKPDYDVMYGEELYDHRFDPEENHNILWGRRADHRKGTSRRNQVAVVQEVAVQRLKQINSGC